VKQRKEPVCSIVIHDLGGSIQVVSKAKDTQNQGTCLREVRFSNLNSDKVRWGMDLIMILELSRGPVMRLEHGLQYSCEVLKTIGK